MSPFPGPLNKDRIGVIDLIRSFSILAVLAHHFVLTFMARPCEWVWLEPFWYRFWSKGWLGVSMFFLVSGYLISKRIDEVHGGLTKPDQRGFYIRRAARILPMLALVCLIGGTFIALNQSNTPGLSSMFGLPVSSVRALFWVSIATFWVNAFVLFVANVPGLQWGILWSLAIEEQFYFIYPLVLKRLGRIEKVAVFLVLVVLVGVVGDILAFKYFPGYENYRNFSTAGFELIAMGCGLYIFRKYHQQLLARHKVKVGWFAVLGLSLAASIYFQAQFKADGFGRIWGATLLGLGMCVFILGAIQWKWMESRWVRWAGFPGRLSYGMYLLHPAVLFVLWPAFGKLGSLSGYALLVIGTLFIAFLSERYVEMPLNRWIRRRLKASA